MSVAAEKLFEQKVKKFLKDEGCWFLKTWGGGFQRDGIPDLLVCCDGVFMAIELKAPKGVPSELQKWNIREIQKAGGYGFILYPDQFETFKMVVQDIKHRQKNI